MNGVVTAGDSQTADAGYALLQEGGNAIDAVVGAAFASWVVEAPLGSPGGGGVMLHGGPGRPFELLDFFTRVPGAGLPPVQRDALDFHAITVDYGPTTQAFHIGKGSVAMPSCVFGLVEAQKRHGRLPLSTVVQPARALASEGFLISPHVCFIYKMLNPILTATPSVARLHQVDGRPPQPRERVTNRDLGHFFERLGAEGEGFLQGEWIDALLAGFGPQEGGRLTRADFNTTLHSIRPALQRPFAGHTVFTPSPPASGGTLVTLGLLLAERVGVLDLPWMSPRWCVAVAGVLRGVSIARSSGFDGRVFEPGIENSLLDADALDGWLAAAAREERSIGETTHISVIDADGMAAGLTMSNGEGCGHAVDGFGVHLNNFLGEEDINPGGFHALPAGSPMTTMMTPTVVVNAAGIPVLVAGSGGANRIRSAVFLAVLNRIGHGRTLDEAANAPRMHVEGDQLWFEELEQLEVAAPQIRAAWERAASFPGKNMFFGGTNLAAFDGSSWEGSGDRRRGGRHRSS